MQKISVIIPSYNCASYISNAIDSVLYQTYKDYEIIIVDDGSTDDTESVVKKIIDNRSNVEDQELEIRYIYQENRGPGAARNFGILNANGDYVAFLDADDILLSNALEMRINFLEKNRDIKFVFTDYYQAKRGDVIAHEIPISIKRKFLKGHRSLIDRQYGENYVFKTEFYDQYLSFTQHPIHTNTILVHKDVLKDIGAFRTDIMICEDLDLWMRIAQKYRVGFINYPTAVYYSNTQCSLLKNKKRYHDCRIKHALKLIGDNRISRHLLHKTISDAYSCMGYIYFAEYDTKNARMNFLKAIQYSPFSIYSYIYIIASILPADLIRKLRNIKKMYR